MIGRPLYRKAVVDDVVGLYAERVLNDLSGAFAVISVDGLFEQVRRTQLHSTNFTKYKSAARAGGVGIRS
jgi:hypothetical protein